MTTTDRSTSASDPAPPHATDTGDPALAGSDRPPPHAGADTGDPALAGVDDPPPHAGDHVVPGGGATVAFAPSGLRGPMAVGATVLSAARRLGVDLDTVCGGRGICGRCQVTVSPPDAAGPRNDVEVAYAERAGRARALSPSRRLGCQVVLGADAVVEVPPESQVHRPVVRTDLALRPLDLDPVVTLHYVELAAPTLGDDRTGHDHLLDRLAADWDLHHVEVTPPALADLAGTTGGVTAIVLRPEPARVTSTGPSRAGAVQAGPARVMAVRPGLVETAHGLAIDLGSTTIAAYLCDLTTGAVVASAGRMNPQIRFGEDLMARVACVMLDPDSRVDLTSAAHDAVGALAAELCDRAGIEVADLAAVTLVANPVMHHLALGIDPTPLGAAPFALATSRPVRLPAEALGIAAPRAEAFVGPCIAGHIGADAAAALLNEGLHRAPEPDGPGVRVVVDIGTNAEILLSDQGRCFAASSPTGPAFEGAQITCGQRATAGAIERVRIDPTTLEPTYRVIGSDRWSDDPGFAEAIAGLDVGGVCGSGIVEIVVELFRAGIIGPDGAFRPDAAQRSNRVRPAGRSFEYVLVAGGVGGPELDAGDSGHDGLGGVGGGPELVFTQGDVRAVQLAKAALRAGIDLLVERAGVDRIDDVALAGAFGAHLDPAYVTALGLVPDGPEVRAVGNAAGAGAIRLLLSAAERAELADAVGDVTRVETATEARFQELFVAAMAVGPADPGLGSGPRTATRRRTRTRTRR